MTEMLNDVLIIGQLEVEKLEYKLTFFNLVEHSRQSPEQIQINLGYWCLIFFTSQYKFLTCCIDEKLLAHILTNLFSNAIQYFSDDGILKLNLVNEDRQTVFEIKDLKIGVFQGDIVCIIELFCHLLNGVDILVIALIMAISKKCVGIYKGKILITSISDICHKYCCMVPLKNKI
jgi:K+-sensing histidine kinase KdpD